MRKKFNWRKILLWLVGFVIVTHLLMFIALYFFQETLLFRPEILTENYTFNFKGDFDEVYIPVEKDVKLHGLLFKANKSKGLVFYLHGNGGSLKGWGSIADTYIDAGYDLFLLDYRGYGKSGGHVESEEQLHSDIDKVYAHMLRGYDQKDVVIAGYSIGTGPATHLARRKNIKALILQAPYYSMSRLMGDKAPVVPEFVKRYKINTFEFIKNVTAPVYMFHGTADELIDYSHSQSLIKCAKPTDVLIPIKGGGHNIKESDVLKREIKRILR